MDRDPIVTDKMVIVAGDILVRVVNDSAQPLYQAALEILEATAPAVWDQAVEACADRIEKLRDNTQQLKLHMGEMEAQEQRTLKAGMGLFAFLLRSLKRSDKTENDNGGCQAKSSTQGETVSAPMEPLQSNLSAEAKEIIAAAHDYLSCDWFPHKSRNGNDKAEIEARANDFLKRLEADNG